MSGGGRLRWCGVVPVRVFVAWFEDGTSFSVPVTDETVIQIGGESFSMEGCLGALVDTDDGTLRAVFDRDAA